MVTVRDFIYVDVERLKSLYSQVFKGVVDTIIQTEVDEYQTADTQKGGIRSSGSTFAERVAEASYKTESRILYDHMYNLLEDRLDRAIVEAKGLSRKNYADVLGQAFMIKVKGAAEVADYKRIKTVFDNFNNITEAINYVSSYGKRHTLEAIKTELWTKIKAEKDRNQKAKLKKRMEVLENQLKEKGQLDNTFLESISFITDMFCSDRIEVTIHPTEDAAEDVIFRAILNERWLRVSADFLRALYGGYPAPNWTMVGHLTYLPVPLNTNSENDDELSEGIDSNNYSDLDSMAKEKPKTMRDGYRQLMIAYQEIEKTFIDSKDFVEVVIWPLAIYRETVIPKIKDNVENNQPPA